MQSNSRYAYRMKRFLITILVIIALFVAAFGLAIALGGPGEPTPMPSINDPFKRLSQFGCMDKILNVVLQLPDVGDMAFDTRLAMSSNIQRIG